MSINRTPRGKRTVLAVAASFILTSFAAIPVFAVGTPYVESTTPADGDVDVATNANLSVTFIEPVTVTDGWFRIDCGASLEHSAVVSGGPVTWTIDPNQDFTPGESCALTVDKAGVTDSDGFQPMSNGLFGFTVAGTETPSLPPADTTFGTFRKPFKALPEVNRARAGSWLWIGFKLDADETRQAIRATSRAYPCGTTPPETATEAVTRGHRAFHAPRKSRAYAFIWQTKRSWKGTCRVFVVGLADGRTQAIAFRFK